MAIASELDERATRPDRRVYRFFKRVMDVLLAVVALLVLALPMLLIALVIRIMDGRPVIYRQHRLGRNGRIITVCKFRSMCPDADAQLERLDREHLAQYRQEFKIEHDPRLTRLGRFLRCTSLDELPQLWNILKGEMSFVGPRPILPEEIACYKPEEQPLLLSVTPGLTGYWQACARPEDTYASGRRQKMELQYVTNCSFLFDLKIFLLTFATVLRKALKYAEK